MKTRQENEGVKNMLQSLHDFKYGEGVYNFYLNSHNTRNGVVGETLISRNGQKLCMLLKQSNKNFGYANVWITRHPDFDEYAMDMGWVTGIPAQAYGENAWRLHPELIKSIIPSARPAQGRGNGLLIHVDEFHILAQALRILFNS